MTYVLVAGTLFKAPDQRTSKAGKLFVTSTLKAKDGEALQWWRVTAFSESVMAELMRLAEGDALSVQGALKVEEYEKDGQKRVSLELSLNLGDGKGQAAAA
jgi:single-stranded DNA-binding protein